MPTDPSVERSLRELHAPRVEPPSPTPASEEAAILAWARQYEARREALAEPSWFGLLGARKAVAAFAGALLVAGACVLPTSYDIPLGIAVDIRAASGERLPVQELSRHVQALSGAAEVDVLMREVVLDGGPPQMQLSIRLWDQNLALGELEPELREQFPALANAEIIETALEGEIETIWARRVAHRAFAISLRDADVEQARQALLLDLQSRGHEPDQVVVMVRDRDDGRREVEVQIQRHVIDGATPPPLDDAPSFFWEMHPSGSPEVQLEAPRAGEPVRIHVVGVHEDH